MKYLVIADVHSNLEALQAVLAEAEKTKYRRILVVGDLVGYNANPNECLELLQKKKDTIFLMGNHDAAACNIIGLENFNPGAAECIAWTNQHLKPEHLEFLKDLPYFFSNEFMIACHGTPMDYLWQYMDSKKAVETLETVTEQLVLCGHTHESFYFQKFDKVASFQPKNYSLDYSKKRTVVSLPALGQPRDGNPETGFAILDFKKKLIEVKRIPYDIQSTAKKIVEAGLPRFMADRLFKGM